MNTLKFLQSRSFWAVGLSVALSMLLVFSVAYSASTISTNISTGGTLSVTGASTLTGAVTASAAVTVGTDLTVTSGARVGTGSTGTHITALADDSLLVEGQSEFDGIAWFDGQVQASSTALFGGVVTLYGNVTFDKAATTTVTLSQTGLNFDSNTFVIDPNSNKVGVGTSTPNIGAVVFGTCSVDLGSITASTTLSANCTSAEGVATSDRVFVTPRSLETHLVMTSASSTAANVIQVSVYNTGVAGDINPDAATWDWMAIR